VDLLSDQEEPVSLAYFKNYAKISDFSDAGDTDPLNFNSDDELIEDLITGARQMLESWTGLSLVPHQWQVKVTNLIGDVELPFSNGVVEFDTFTDSDATVISDYVIYQGSTVLITSPMYRDMNITYTVTPVCPARLKTAICAEVLYRYENRGDITDEGYLSEKAIAIASPFKRVSTWLA